MASTGVQIVCVFLGLLGLIACIVTCAIPRWKVLSFAGQNIVTAQSDQEGLWMSCVVQSTGQQQCKAYDSLLVLGADLQAARAMTIISCAVVTIALLLIFAGANFTTCIQNEDAKPKVCLVAGICLLIAGLLLIIPVSWTAHRVITDFHNPLVLRKMELGLCVFVGWAGGVLLLVAGGLLCCFSRPNSGSSSGRAQYYSNSSAPAGKNYV